MFLTLTIFLTGRRRLEWKDGGSSGRRFRATVIFGY